MAFCGDGRCNPELGECENCLSDCPRRKKNCEDDNTDDNTQCNTDDNTQCLYYGLDKCGDSKCSPEFGECTSCKENCQGNVDEDENKKCPIFCGDEICSHEECFCPKDFGS